jgi:preprotein translocase subunit SecY
MTLAGQGPELILPGRFVILTSSINSKLREGFLFYPVILSIFSVASAVPIPFIPLRQAQDTLFWSNITLVLPQNASKTLWET